LTSCPHNYFDLCSFQNEWLIVVFIILLLLPVIIMLSCPKLIVFIVVFAVECNAILLFFWNHEKCSSSEFLFFAIAIAVVDCWFNFCRCCWCCSCCGLTTIMMLYRAVIVALFLKIVSSSAALCRCILFPNEIIAILFAAGRRLVACGCGLRSALQQLEQKQHERSLSIAQNAAIMAVGHVTTLPSATWGWCWCAPVLLRW